IATTAATATFNISGLANAVNYSASQAPSISGNLNLGTFSRTLNIGDNPGLLVDALLTANLRGSADLVKGATPANTGVGTLLMSGNNVNYSGNVFITAGNPAGGQPNVIVATDTAFGTGIVFPNSGTAISGDGGVRTLANR